MSSPTNALNSTSSASRSGGQLIVDALQIHGVDTIFGVPGESYLPVLDALHEHKNNESNIKNPIRFIINRQEGGSAFMAEAYGKLTGKPGICFVTRGPGATNASIGVHTAYQDSTPMILFIGQVGNDFVEREAFQEIDYRRMYGQMAKWVAQIDRADRVHEYVARAFQVATSGRPGPVVLALPEDMLSQLVEVDKIPQVRHYQTVQAAPSNAQMNELSSRLAAAKRPIVILGGGGWNKAACDNLQRFAEQQKLPISCAFRFQDLFDNQHPNYAGDVGIGINPKLAERIKQADLVIAIGPRLGEMTTSGYSILEAPVPKQSLIHIHADALELGRVYQADMLINSGMPQIAEALAALPTLDSSAWQASVETARADYIANQAPSPIFQNNTHPLNLWQVVQEMSAQVPADTIITNGAGNHTTWAHRYYRYGAMRTQLAPTSGAMGYSVPSGIAAKITHPERTVITFAGDGEFMMNGQELATAVQYRAGVVIILFNNGMFGTIRMHQEREFPNRVVGTELHNPDFAALARAYGGSGEVVTHTEEFGPALQRALAFSRENSLPALIELRYDGNLITPGATLEAIRQVALGNK
ncbi:thiamine pyrophosphate-binding protein [Solimicrobium silvestre]|uniref:Thiamine pyrophosphate-requiring enzyme n=1 Tax=Solimicrobium silvestre TaxID=2099400 RepID=A0A2S9H5E9_9BURK|nr:thiamine pyrophosphate-binding protein [Solimicrobium silvestre]PRC95215.1 Thiamine pyrophosphate-requiring enzyme [Solimicrobium silvestre]